MSEKQIAKIMKSLDVSREEAIELIKDDETINKMSMGEINNDLTPEQKKNSKKATITTGDKQNRKKVVRERKPDKIKRELIETIAHNLDRACTPDDYSPFEVPQKITIVNPEKEITFEWFGEKYSVSLTRHRKPKGED